MAVMLILTACATPEPASTTVLSSSASSVAPKPTATITPVSPQGAVLTQVAKTPTALPIPKVVWIQKNSETFDKIVKGSGLNCMEYFPGSPGPAGYCGVMLASLPPIPFIELRDLLRIVFPEIASMGGRFPIPWSIPIYRNGTKRSQKDFQIPESFKFQIPSGLKNGETYWAKAVGYDIFPGDVINGNTPLEFGLLMVPEDKDLIVRMLPGYQTLKFADIETKTVLVEAFILNAAQAMQNIDKRRIQQQSAVTVDGTVVVIGILAVGGIVYEIVTPFPDPGDLAVIATWTEFLRRLSNTPALQTVPIR